MITDAIVFKVRNWFAERGLEFTPREVRVSLENNRDLQLVTPAVVEGMRNDPHVAPLIRDFTAYILALKQGRA